MTSAPPAQPAPGSAALTREGARVLRSERPLDLAATISPLRRGFGDPCHRQTPDGSHWHASRMPTGEVTYRLRQLDRHTVDARAWGPGGEEFLDRLPAMLCLDEDVSDFAPEHPKVAEAHRLHPGLRMLRTGLVWEALVPAVLEQKVHTKTAHDSWRKLVWRYGTPAPGPAPEGLRIMPDAETWRHIPSWVYHRANVGPQRSKTIVLAARIASKLEEAATLGHAEAAQRLRTVPGIGIWTAAEIAQRAFGDPDALSVGDFHLAATVGWTLLGEPIDDDTMVEYLEPLRPHRYRAVRLLGLAGFAHKPKFGPRTPYTDHSRI